MPLFSPSTRNESMVRKGQDMVDRGIARIAGPMPTGNTVYKKNGTWHQGATPTGADVAGADPIFVGGHVYVVSWTHYEELVAAGFATAKSRGLYPGAATFPSSTTYPGAS